MKVSKYFQNCFGKKRRKRGIHNARLGRGLAGNCVNVGASGSFCGGHTHAGFSRFTEKERGGVGKNGGRLASRATSDSSLLPAIFIYPPALHQRSARFSIRCRDNEVLIATGDRFESQCTTAIRVFRPPLFPHFSIRPFYSVPTAVLRVHRDPKWYQRFFR